MIRPLTLAALLASSALLGCGVAPAGMVEVDGDVQLYDPPADRALLLIAPLRAERPVFVIDEEGEFVASVRRRMHALVPIEPGRRTLFFIGPNNVVPVLIDVTAGRLYPVALETGNQVTVAGAKIMLTALPMPRTAPAFDDLIGAVRSTRACTVDPSAGEAWVRDHPEEIRAAIRDGRVAWVGGGRTYQSRQTLGASAAMLPRHVEVFTRSER